MLLVCVSMVNFHLLTVSCPFQDGYVVHRESRTCFRPVESPILKWEDARDKCASDGEILAILQPVDKLEFLILHFRTNPVGQWFPFVP